jgi:hypothetical protein
VRGPPSCSAVGYSLLCYTYSEYIRICCCCVTVSAAAPIAVQLRCSVRAAPGLLASLLCFRVSHARAMPVPACCSGTCPSTPLILVWSPFQSSFLLPNEGTCFHQPASSVRLRGRAYPAHTQSIPRADSQSRACALDAERSRHVVYFSTCVIKPQVDDFHDPCHCWWAVVGSSNVLDGITNPKEVLAALNGTRWQLRSAD